MKKVLQKKRKSNKKQIANPKVDGVSSGIQSICRLDNGYYVGNSSLGLDKFYTLLDSDLNTVIAYGDYPLREFGEDKKALKEHVFFREQWFPMATVPSMVQHVLATCRVITYPTKACQSWFGSILILISTIG